MLRARTHISGQALIESVILLMLLSTLLLLLAEIVMPLHESQLARIEDARTELWRWRINNPVKVSDSYAFAESATTLLLPLKGLTGLALEQNSMRSITPSTAYAGMARISDAWSPSQAREFTSRPAKLTPMSHLTAWGGDHIQDVISMLHFTEEFDSDSLRFGYVANQATPEELPCLRGTAC